MNLNNMQAQNARLIGSNWGVSQMSPHKSLKLRVAGWDFTSDAITVTWPERK
jgi:hypothetical protein